MNHRYRPFEKELFELSGDDLAGLRHVHEGWYVEYKSESIKPRDIAKSLASFANQLGGWLFVGVSEDRKRDIVKCCGWRRAHPDGLSGGFDVSVLKFNALEDEFNEFVAV